MQIINIIQKIIEIIYGGLFLFYGLNGFFHFVPVPKSSEAGEKFIEALYAAKFIMPAVKFIEIISGVSLLLSLFPQVGILILTPIIFGIAGYYFFLNFKKDYLLFFILLAHLFLLFQYKVYWIQFFN